jgi:hypothetical protein
MGFGAGWGIWIETTVRPSETGSGLAAAVSGWARSARRMAGANGAGAARRVRSPVRFFKVPGGLLWHWRIQK